MNDCCNGSTDQKECCKAAVEAYKKQISQEIQLREERKSKWFVRGLALLLTIELVYLWRGEWNLINGMYLVIALLCWVSILLDVRKWLKAKKQPQVFTPPNQDEGSSK